MSKQWQKRVERFKQIRSGGNDLFPEAVKSPATLPLPEKRPMSKRFSLKQLIERLPREGDMFPQLIQKKELLDAVDRLLPDEKDWIERLWFLRKCAHEIGAHYPDIAAMILERAGYSIWRLPLRNATSFWQRNYTDAAEYWQKAGNSEEREDMLLRATVLTLKENREQASCGKKSAANLDPLWSLAKIYHDEGKLEEECGLLVRIADICIEGEDFQRAAYALIKCAYWHTLRKDWEAVGRIGEQVAGFGEWLDEENKIYESEAYTLIAMSILFGNSKRSCSEAIKYLDWALEIQQDSDEIDEKDTQWINRLLARAWEKESEEKLNQYFTERDEWPLREAERAARNSLEYLAVTQDVPISFFGRQYVTLSTIYTLLGEFERAEDYRNKAMTLGYDLSEE